MILYHGKCTDGWTAAWAVWKATNDEDIRPVMFGQPPPTDIEGKDVVIVDFAYPKDTLLAMAKVAKSVLVLDHHKTNKEALESLLPGKGTCPRNSDIVFDMEKSGAGLAWDYFHDSARPRLVNYVEDRDLWRWKLPHSKEISAYIHSIEYDEGNGLKVWDNISKRLDFDEGFYGALSIGITLLRADKKEVDRHLTQAYECELAGYRVKAVNATVLNSEIANALSVDPDGTIRPFGVCWSMTEDGRYRYSLRTAGLPGQADVSAVAKLFGGGGHKDAAGFSSDYLVCVKRKED